MTNQLSIHFNFIPFLLYDQSNCRFILILFHFSCMTNQIVGSFQFHSNFIPFFLHDQSNRQIIHFTNFIPFLLHDQSNCRWVPISFHFIPILFHFSCMTDQIVGSSILFQFYSISLACPIKLSVRSIFIPNSFALINQIGLYNQHIQCLTNTSKFSLVDQSNCRFIPILLQFPLGVVPIRSSRPISVRSTAIAVNRHKTRGTLKWEFSKR